MPVPPSLAPYVASLVAYDVDLGASGIHRGLPATALTLVLPVGDPLDVAWADRPGSRTVAWSSVAGLHTGPAEIRHGGTQRGVQVALTPRGARAVLGVSAAELSGRLLTLGDLAPALRDLPERVASAPARSRAHVVARALAAEAARHDPPPAPAAVARAVDLLARGGRVQDVADEVGYSRRRLGALVRAETGLAPKQLQRVARFQRSRSLLGHRPLADVAARCGYADQAHLTREWVGLAGCPPTTWLREEFPFLQDPEAPDR